jgi:hypothetical protein
MIIQDRPGLTRSTYSVAATQDEQASYVIQNAAYAFMAGADVVFHFSSTTTAATSPPERLFHRTMGAYAPVEPYAGVTPLD